MRRLVAANWKMNGSQAALAEIASVPRPSGCDVVWCLPGPLLGVAAMRGLGPLGGQDCHPKPSGPHTGDVSAALLAEAGATHVIVGHSERRADHGEADSLVKSKAEAAIAAGLTPIVCLGETRAEREAGRTAEVIRSQLAGSWAGAGVLAYEPVWAIGTGLTASLDQIAEAHAVLRADLGPDIPILYGGSVKPGNAGDIAGVDGVDGALVGGASLTATDFAPIVAAFAA